MAGDHATARRPTTDGDSDQAARAASSRGSQSVGSVPARVLDLQRRAGNEAVLRTLDGAPRVQRRVPVWHNLPSPEGIIRTHAYNVRGWRQFLTNADEVERVRELNAFMAVALGHPLYEQSRSEEHQAEQRRFLNGLGQAPMESRVALMIAFLTVPDSNIDLLEQSPFGGPFAMTGLLLRNYVSRYYRPAIEQLATMAGQEGGVAAAQVNPDNVAEFLAEAEDSITALRAQFSGRYGYTDEAHDEAAAEIGVEGPVGDQSLSDQLQAEAIAGAHVAAAAAMGEAFRNPDRASSIGDAAEHRIRAHAQVLRGIIERHDQVQAANEALINAAVSAAFTAGGPLTGGLRGFASAVAGTAVDVVKSAATTCATGLAGKSGDELRRGARSEFYIAVQEMENSVRAGTGGSGPGYDAVHELADDLHMHFHVGTD